MMTKTWLIGTVESVELTQNSLGHQVTTIDGTRYATWMDFRKFCPKKGERVEYSVGESIQGLRIPTADIRRASTGKG